MPLVPQLSVVQTLPSSQLTGLPALHAPPTQPSPLVQASPSLHGLPFFASVCWQPAALVQVSMVQACPSSQLFLTPALHTPVLQTSTPLQTSPSEHVVPFSALFAQPVLLSQLSAVQGLPSPHASALPAAQLPAAQWSPAVQALPSVHVVPLSGLWLQPDAGLQPSAVHGLPSSQLSALPGWHALLAQESPTEHWLLSSHGVPFSALVVQPFVGSQPSAVHALPSSQVVALPPVHAPALHASPVVQASPSEHALPLTLVCTQPFVGWHTSLVQPLLSSHAFGLEPLHAPPLQTSLVVHTLPSSQAAPAFALCAQPLFLSQLSVVQGSPSPQANFAPDLQLPDAHASLAVQASPSEHLAPVNALCQQPLAALQPSVVQGLPSSQLGPPLPLQTPDLQASLLVHALPSLQLVPLSAAWLQPLLPSQPSVVQGLPSSQSF